MLWIIARSVIADKLDDLVAEDLTAFDCYIRFDPFKIEVVLCPDDEERACLVDLEKPLKIRVTTV